LRGKESLVVFRRRRWCGEDWSAAHFLRRKSTAPDAGQCGHACPEFREGNHSRHRRRRDPERKDVDLRVSGQDSNCGSGLGNRTQNQVLPFWSAFAEEWKVIARGIGARKNGNWRPTERALGLAGKRRESAPRQITHSTPRDSR